MRSSRFRLGSLWVALSALPALQAASPPAPDCSAVARNVSKQVSAKPERVLLIVEDTLVVNDFCACEVVKAAIAAAAASPKLVGQIVLVAVNAAPAKAELVADCAKAASPDAAADVDRALDKALGANRSSPASTTPVAKTDGAPTPSSSAVDGSPKQPVKDAKNPAPKSEDSADFGLSPVTIGGVYLVYPGSGGSPQTVSDAQGNLYYIGPNGQRVPLNPAPPISQRPVRPPGVIIIRPPSPTASDSSPPIPTDPIP